MTYYAITDNRLCLVACSKELKDAGLCICNNRFTNNMWRVILEYNHNNPPQISTDYDFINDAPLTC